MTEREYDPSFATGLSKPVTIMDIARDHAAMTANCGCSICWAARQARIRADKFAEAERQRALTERLMKEWP
jgi:hypothetical protein